MELGVLTELGNDFWVDLNGVSFTGSRICWTQDS